MKNRKSQLITIAILLIILLTLTISPSCDDGPTDPIIKPGRRDYTWTRDTLINDDGEYPSIHGIWGASPNNIWVGGSDFWHFNGIKWSEHIPDEFNTIGGFYGINENNIWAGTSLNAIWHYDGDHWSEHSTFKHIIYDGVSLNSIDGFSNKEIYAVGSAGNFYIEGRTRVIMHYKGDKWNFIKISDKNEILGQVKVDDNNNKVFIEGYRISNPQMPQYHYYLEGDSLIEILNSSNITSMGKINGRVYHVADKKIQKYVDNKLKTVVDFSNTNFAGRIWGRSEKDFFCVTWDYTIAHYDGTNLKDVYPLTYDYYVADALIFENDVFFICDEFGTNVIFIIHGRLD